MSNLNITRNIFLEKEELVRFQQFMANDLSQQLFLRNSVTFGIVVSDFIANTDFKVEAGSNASTIKVSRDSYALDSDGLLIHQLPFDNLAIPNNGQYYWIRISHKYDPTEVGTCSIDADGIVSGVGTLFTSVLRGHSTDVPTKIKFVKADGSVLSNNQVYEVVSVNSDTTIHLTAGTFTAESGLKVVVIGTTPISEFVTSDQLNGLYQYDSCTVEIVGEEAPNTPPTINYIPNKTFYLARVISNSGVVTVTDKRTDYWMFNVPALKEKLAKNQNLSDLTDLVAARNNLDVYSKEEIGVVTSPMNSHNQVVGVTDITCTGLANRIDIPAMTITYTPKGNNALIMFSAIFWTDTVNRQFYLYLVKDGVDVLTTTAHIYQWHLPMTLQFLVPVSVGIATTIKVAWKGDTNIKQEGTTKPRVLTIIDLP